MRLNLLAQAIVGLVVAAGVDAAVLQTRVAACAALPAGSGPKANPDTVPAFLALPAISNAAGSASTPKGYVKQFSNLQGANIVTHQYLTFAYLTSYDTDLCAAKCNAVKGCNSFNLYFERDPSQEPGSGNSGCANPCSTTNIKCALFSGTVTSASATNKGQFRNKFQVAIAGSNGYTNALYLVSQASSEIGTPSNTAQPYCSSILGYSTPVVTTTIFTTLTPLGTKTTTSTETDVITTTQVDSSTQTATLYTTSTATLLSFTTLISTEQDTTTTTATSPLTTILFNTRTVSTTARSSPTTTTITSTLTLSANAMTKRDADSWTTINGVVLPALPALPTSPVPSSFQKRDISLPSVLSKYPASIITSACSLAVSRVTKTSTVTSLETSTANTLFATQVISTATSTTATALSSTTLNTIATLTSVQFATSFSTVQITSTLTSTQTVVESPIITSISEMDVTATSTETQTLTVTSITTTTAAAPVCTATNYYFQIVGGANDGRFFATNDPSNPNAVTYSFVTSAVGMSNAHSFNVHSDGRVYGSSNLYAWVTRNNALYYVLSMSDQSQATYQISYLSCSVTPSSAVSGVAGAVGVLTCRRDDGSATNLVSCANLGNDILQTPNVAGAGNGCVALTVAAIPVSGGC